MDNSLHNINEKFAIPGQVSFHPGPGGLAMAVINNQYALATMTLAGGHVMTYTPHGSQPVLWVSPKANFTVGKKAMRGGIPVCWPWFAMHPTDPEEMPMHGFVRTMLWELVGTRALPDGGSEIRMIVRDTPETLAIWPNPFELEMIATVGKRLNVEWIARNTGNAIFQYTGALHPYYNISDIRAITIHGLEGTDYLDKNDGMARKNAPDPLKITRPIDAIFLNTTTGIVIEDPGFKRNLHISKTGSHTTVVWNPGEQAAQMSDVGPGQQQFFVCAEAANTGDDIVSVEPGSEGRLSMQIWAD